MSLKQLIKKERMLNPAVDAELVLPGEPMIYSIKYPLANRSRSTQFFRNIQWKSLLKSFFKSYYKTSIPVVIIVRFYVTPPENVKISLKELEKEETPAVFAYEACDYLLSFLEMLHHVLINSYRQVVKIEVDKFYSSTPRTVFKFMKWEHYVQLQSSSTVHTKTESVSENREMGELQPVEQGDVEDTAVRQVLHRKSISREQALAYWSAPGDSAFSDSSTLKSSAEETVPSELVASCEEA